MNNDLMFSSDKDSWETPQDFFDGLNEEFDFSLDAAATQLNSKCPMYLNDAFKYDWFGRVFCNPPYGAMTGKFIERGYNEFHNGHAELVVFLVAARPDVKWFHNFVWDSVNHELFPHAEIRFVKGRLKFGNSKNSAPFPSAIIVFKGKEF